MLTRPNGEIIVRQGEEIVNREMSYFLTSL
jgi:hypothetical protein